MISYLHIMQELVNLYTLKTFDMIVHGVSNYFESRISGEDLVAQINEYCKKEMRTIDGISYSVIPLDNNLEVKKSPYIYRVCLHSAIVYWNQRF